MSPADTKSVHRYAATAVLLIVVSACSEGASPRPVVEPTGPPQLRSEVIQRHVEEFGSVLADRRAGTAGEGAASAYVLGHLQQAGYVVLLDSVPLADLIRSTNIVAQPPSGDAPEVVVAVPYDEPPPGSSARSYDEALALMLELARALRVSNPDHSVEFVALGAEFVADGGALNGRLGSRRLAQSLLDSGASPLIVLLDTGSPTPRLRGDVPSGLEDVTTEGQGEDPSPGEGMGPGTSAEVFRRAGFDVVVVAGPLADVGAMLLRYLSSDPL
jgi:hypothetical protein